MVGMVGMGREVVWVLSLYLISEMGLIKASVKTAAAPPPRTVIRPDAVQQAEQQAAKARQILLRA